MLFLLPFFFRKISLLLFQFSLRLRRCALFITFLFLGKYHFYFSRRLSGCAILIIFLFYFPVFSKSEKVCQAPRLVIAASHPTWLASPLQSFSYLYLYLEVLSNLFCLYLYLDVLTLLLSQTS